MYVGQESCRNIFVGIVLVQCKDCMSQDGCTYGQLGAGQMDVGEGFEDCLELRLFSIMHVLYNIDLVIFDQ